MYEYKEYQRKNLIIKEYGQIGKKEGIERNKTKNVVK